MKKTIACIAFLAISTGCVAQEPASFQTDIPDGPRPWLHENFDSGDNRFTFAVFSDLQGGERPRVFDVAIAQLSLLRPEPADPLDFRRFCATTSNWYSPGSIAVPSLPDFAPRWSTSARSNQAASCRAQAIGLGLPAR